MGACPKCNDSVTDEFGLVVCAGCGITLFVDMDGVPVMSSPEGVEVPATEELSGPFDSEDPYLAEPVSDDGSQLASAEEFHAESSEYTAEVEQLEDGLDETEPAEAGFDSPTSEIVEEYAVDGEDVEGDSAVEYQEPVEENVSSEEAVASEEYFDFEDPESEENGADAETKEKDNAEPSYNLEDMSEIADYGNSEVSQGRDGTLQFTISISGIDSKDIRDDLGYALEDSRFLWDIGGILESIKNGSVEIENVSAIKAAVLLQRLRGLPLQISWEQNAIFKA